MSRTKSAGKLDNKRGRKSLNKQLIKIDVDSIRSYLKNKTNVYS